MIDLPDRFCPIAGGFAPFVRSLSGGQSLSGFEQVQSQMHDRWSAALTFLMRSKADIFAMRSLLTQLRGRSGTVRVPTFERGRAPFGRTVADPPISRWFPDLAGTPYEFGIETGVSGTATITGLDRISFATTAGVLAIGMAVTLDGIPRRLLSISGSGPHLCAFTPKLDITTSALLTMAATANAAALNATTLDIHVTSGAPPIPGQYFSIADRLYMANACSVVAPNVYRLAIWPWLRVATVGGEAVNFATPRCEMRLASDDEGADALRSLTSRRFGQVALRFDEAA